MTVNSSSDESKYRADIREPEFVMGRLKDHRAILTQDVGDLRMRWPVYVHNAAIEGLEPVAYLRSKLLIANAEMSGRNQPTDATTAAWHPFILEYCQTLGVVGDAVDRLYQRIVSGDVTDKRAVETEADDAFAQLDAGHAEARAQWKAGEAVIKSPKVHKRIERQSENEGEAAELLPQTQSPKEWTDWRQPKVAVNWFPTVSSPRGWSAFAKRLREEGKLKNHPTTGDKLVSIHRSVFARIGLALPSDVELIAL